MKADLARQDIEQLVLADAVEALELSHDDFGDGCGHETGLSSTLIPHSGQTPDVLPVRL